MFFGGERKDYLSVGATFPQSAKKESTKALGIKIKAMKQRAAAQFCSKIQCPST